MKIINKITLSFLISIILLCYAYNSFSQEITVRSTIDTNKILIGDQIILTLQAKTPHHFGEGLHFPVFYDTIISAIEIIDKTNIDTTIDKNQNLILKQNYLITSFDSGAYIIPPFIFTYMLDSIEDTIKTSPLLLEVYTVEVDTSQAIKDIKEPYKAPLTLKEFLNKYYPYILGSIFLIAIILFVIYYLKKRKKHEPILKITKPKEPAHIIALRELDKLKREKLWQQNKVKKYHTRLTEIIRTYIENRFQIMALEQTSYEILQSFTHSGLVNNQSYEILSQMLTLADLVKFAKEKPLPDENEFSLKNAYLFVNNTKAEIKKEDTMESKK